MVWFTRWQGARSNKCNVSMKATASEISMCSSRHTFKSTRAAKLASHQDLSFRLAFGNSMPEKLFLLALHLSCPKHFLYRVLNQILGRSRPGMRWWPATAASSKTHPTRLRGQPIKDLDRSRTSKRRTTLANHDDSPNFHPPSAMST